MTATSLLPQDPHGDAVLDDVDLRIATWPSPILEPAVHETGTSSIVRARQAIVQGTLAAADAAAALLATVAVIVWAEQQSLSPTLVALPALLLVINKVAGLYDRDSLVLRRSTLDELPLLVLVSSVYALLASAASETLFGVRLGPQELVVLWGVTAGLVGISRTAARALLHATAPSERCFLVGGGEHLGHIAERIRAVCHADVVGAVALNGPSPEVMTSGDMRWLVERFHVHRVILAPFGLDATDTVHLVRVAKAAGVRVSLLPRMLEAVGAAAQLEQVDGMTMLGVRPFGLSRSQQAVRRAFNLIVGTVTFIGILPMLVTIAVLIRLDSPGPVFFRQTRIGRNGVPFRMWKFRSMVADAEVRKEALRPANETVGLFKLTEDPRITRLGRFLRRSSLDELPQILNVLAGEMSLVGPRPLVAEEDVLIEGILRSRLALTPGMTGQWQLLGATRVPLDEMLSMDYLYVANWSLWQDIKILLRTVPHVLGARGI